MTAAATATTRESLRQTNAVGLISTEQEGYSRRRVPNGVYGFTDAPGTPDAGLFRKQGLLNYEVHKLPSGATHWLVYVTAEQAAVLARNEGTHDFFLYPEAYGEARQLISLAESRILRSKPVSRIDGNYWPVTIGPAA